MQPLGATVAAQTAAQATATEKLKLSGVAADAAGATALPSSFEAGSTAGKSTAAGILTQQLPITAQASGIAADSGNDVPTVPLGGSGADTSTASGLPSESLPIGGAAADIGGQAGKSQASLSVSGSITGQGQNRDIQPPPLIESIYRPITLVDASGSPIGIGLPTTALIDASTASEEIGVGPGWGGIFTSINVGGIISGAGVSAAAPTTVIPLVGATSGTAAGATAAPGLQLPISGLISQASGAVIQQNPKAILEAAVQAVTQASALLTMTQQLLGGAGGASGSSAVSQGLASLALNGVMESLANANSSVSVALELSSLVAGQANLSALASSAPTVSLGGMISGAGAVSSTGLSQARTITGAAQAIATAAATLTGVIMTQSLSSTVAGLSSASATLSTVQKLLGVIAGRASAAVADASYDYFNVHYHIIALNVISSFTKAIAACNMIALTVPTSLTTAKVRA
jgi:hypothetical protein